jgi:hypothetical protein
MLHAALKLEYVASVEKLEGLFFKGCTLLKIYVENGVIG